MTGLKALIRRTPLVGPFVRRLYEKWTRTFERPFSGSRDYWIARYKAGGNSGPGSYNQLAVFKADTLNRFVRDRSVETVIEFGCGDGNQLTLAEYPSYIGFDVSPTAISLCENRFLGDATKRFRLLNSYKGHKAELTLSIDVIYHLVEDTVFCEYMQTLFDAAERFVIIYSSNTDNDDPAGPAHIRHRRFSNWVETNRTEWELSAVIPNRYPYSGDSTTGSLANFYVYEKSGS